MPRRVVVSLLALLMLWHGLAMTLLGTDLADAHPAILQSADISQTPVNSHGGSLADHFVDDQPGQLLQVPDLLIGSIEMDCISAMVHSSPLPPKDVIHQSPLLDGLHRPPNSGEFIGA